MSEVDKLRIDVWLWRARFFKTRSLATRFLAGTRTRLTRHGQTRLVGKTASFIMPGDRLTLPLKSGIVHLEILELGYRRGPPAEAQALYERLELSVGD